MQYEFKILDLDVIVAEDIEDKLAQYGRDGWHVVHWHQPTNDRLDGRICYGRVVLERSKPAERTAPIQPDPPNTAPTYAPCLPVTDELSAGEEKPDHRPGLEFL